jgi:hypothetical protein
LLAKAKPAARQGRKATDLNEDSRVAIVEGDPVFFVINKE